MVLWVSLIVAVIGAVLYVVAANPKAAELGRIAYFAGLFWLVAEVGKIALRLVPIVVAGVVVVACGWHEAPKALPGEQCARDWVTCTDQHGSCCPPNHECRAPIPAEGRGPFCANIDVPRNWSNFGAGRDGGAGDAGASWSPRTPPLRASSRD